MRIVNPIGIPRSRRARRLGAVAIALGLTAAACGSDDEATPADSEAPAGTEAPSDTEAAPETEAPTDTEAPADTEAPTDTEAPAATDEPAGSDVPSDSAAPADGEPTLEAVDPERCQTNRDAGTITYLSSFDFAAAASIVEVVLADANGYFEDMCLDVELRPSFSTANYTLVGSNQAQFASAGGYTEVLNFTGEGAEFLITVDFGKSPINALITPEGGATELSELEGSTIGVKGDLPPSLVALLADAGLARGEDYDEVLLDGFDPQAHLATGIDALPVYKSNEPGQLDAAGVGYTLFDPTEAGIPGTFGLLYTSAAFAAENPTVVEDFTRAALKGMEDAIADPEAAVAASIEQIDAAGNQSFLTFDGELFRWNAELAEIQASTPEGENIGVIDPAVFEEEYTSYVEAGVWPDGAPDDTKPYDETIAAGVYGDDGAVAWPN